MTRIEEDQELKVIMEALEVEHRVGNKLLLMIERKAAEAFAEGRDYVYLRLSDLKEVIGEALQKEGNE